MEKNEKDCWNPQQYQKFTKERSQPFYDLMALIRRKPKMTAVDLGCGTGELTKILHETLDAKETRGIDPSEAMLKESNAFVAPGLRFELLTVEDYRPKEKVDLIFSNAALQWVPHHRELFERLSHYLSSEGQFAIQVPANFDYPTHTIAKEIGEDSPFKDYLDEGRMPSVLKIEDYSQLFYQLKFKKQSVSCVVYPVILNSTEGLIEWVKGSLLTHYRSHLPKELYELFLERYRERIFAHFGDQQPFYLPFKRILIWGEK